MPNRIELRTILRLRLEDTGAGPLWDDLTLNEALAAAVLRYGLRVPREAVATVVIPAGATSVPLPVGLDPSRITRVLDERGSAVPRARAVPDPAVVTAGGMGGLAQAWRVWDGTLRLERPAGGGTWRVEYLGPRAVPADDLTTLDLLPGDDEAITELAVGLLLRRRIVEDAKRGMATSPALAREVERAESTAWRLLDRRRRVALGGYLT